MISILYVDDENVLLEATRLYLERTGEFTVTTCLSAKEALNRIESTTFDAVVADYEMPGMDGLAFLKVLRSANNSIPFILFTGKGREEVAIEALNSGADFYLQKGGDPRSLFAELTNRIRQAVQRQRAEQALLESEGRYRAIFEKSADAIFVMSDRFLDCNPTAERIFRCNREDIIGKTPAALSPPGQPCGGTSADLAADHIRSASEGVTKTFPWVHCRKDGTPFPTQVTLIPAQVRGDSRLIAIVRDCSPRGQDEDQFRNLARFVELDPDPVIEAGNDGEIRYANPACHAILANLKVPPDPAAFLPEDYPALVTGTDPAALSSFSREVRVGTAIFAETIAYDPQDRTFRIFAHEITSRTFETSALEQANRKLNLLSGITRHDIKNKLTGVMGYLELARGSTRDPEMIEYLSRAEISATAIRQQIEFTKEYENLGVKMPVWQEVSGVIDGAVKLLDRGSVSIKDDTRGLSIYADPMLAKVFYCLLENSLIHGKPLTKIGIHGAAAPAGYLLVVEDDGPGVPSDRKEKIFNKNVGRNGGFGLFLAREILGITGITVEEKGEPGKGARFEISIPSGKFHIKSTE
jgi:PAS domain S-box-containing protein